MDSFKSIIGVLIVFTLGIIAGISIDHWYMIRKVQKMRQEGPQTFNKDLSNRLLKELHLSPEQYTQISAIVDSTFTKIHNFHRETVSKTINNYFADGNAAINAILNAEQKTIFNTKKELFLSPTPPLVDEEQTLPLHERRPPPHRPPPHHRPPHERKW